MAPRRLGAEVSFFISPTKSPEWGLVGGEMEVSEFLLIHASTQRLQGGMETPEVGGALQHLHKTVCVCVCVCARARARPPPRRQKGEFSGLWSGNRKKDTLCS